MKTMTNFQRRFPLVIYSYDNLCAARFPKQFGKRLFELFDGRICRQVLLIRLEQQGQRFSYPLTD